MEPFDLIVIGGGPGGYVAALRAAACGMRTALIERDRVGGVCLNWGCIPTKALLHSARLWRMMRGARRHGLQAAELSCDYAAVQRRSRQTVDRLARGVAGLLARAGVVQIAGFGRLAGHEGIALRVEVLAGGAPQNVRRLSAAKLILAPGGRPRPLPGIPFDGERVISSREALELTAIPERLLIAGAGVIGMEFADLLATFGAAVTVVEILPRILPAEDQEGAAAVRAALSKRGVRFLTERRISAATPEDGRLQCRLDSGETLLVDRLLVATGIVANLEQLGLDSVSLTPRAGFLPTDRHLLTAAPGVYAIGDVTGPPHLAHRASAQGIHAAEHAAGRELPEYDPAWTPAVVYTQPQLAAVGIGEETARERGGALRIGRFPFSASGKAMTDGEITGFVKVILEAETERLLGAVIVGAEAGELIAQATLIGRLGLRASEVIGTQHPHPTLSEALPEALAVALGSAIHG